MKARSTVLLVVPVLLLATACARSETVHADAAEIEAAVKEANEQAEAIKETK